MSWAELSDVRMYYEVRGAGWPVLLVPGLGATCRSWDPIVPRLAERFTVITMDNRGVGQSLARRSPRTLRDYSADLIELVDHLQLGQVHIMGLSLGGIIAQRWAADHPDRVGRLVLVSCTHRFGPYLREMAGLLGATLRDFPSAVFTRVLHLLGSGPAYLDADPQRLDEAVRQAERAGVPRADVLRQLECLVASEPRTEADAFQIRCPTLVVAGQYDAIIPHYYARRMAESVPGSRFLLVEDAGHNPLSECPDRVLPAIISFLTTGELSQSGPGLDATGRAA